MGSTVQPPSVTVGPSLLSRPEATYPARVDLLGGLFSLVQLATYVFVVFGLFGFIEVLTRRAEAFVAAGKLTKPAWAAILGVSMLLLYRYSFLSFFGPLAIVAIIVYFVDVRPAVRRVSGGSRGNEGPYGPW